MSAQHSRSDEVIEDYKKHKLARSALRRIYELLQAFEEDRAFDKKLARFGVGLMLLLVAVSLFWLFGGDTIILR